MYNKKINSGYAILLATVIGSIVLAIGLAIFSITYKEYLISASQRDSQFAFYAADTAVECVLLWDFRGDALIGKNVFVENSSIVQDPGAPRCMGVDISSSNWNVDASLVAATTTFTLPVGGTNDACALVSVAKYQRAGSPLYRTTIEARGQTFCGSPGNPRRVERAIITSY